MTASSWYDGRKDCCTLFFMRPRSVRLPGTSPKRSFARRPPPQPAQADRVSNAAGAVGDSREAAQLGHQAVPEPVTRSCIRCPVLQLDPQQRPRLIEIIRNLHERITEARANGWLGEVEGLQVSLNAAMAKLTSLNRTSTDVRRQLVDLGMPLFTDTPGP
jgi:hypothetical protein